MRWLENEIDEAFDGEQKQRPPVRLMDKGDDDDIVDAQHADAVVPSPCLGRYNA